MATATKKATAGKGKGKKGERPVMFEHESVMVFAPSVKPDSDAINAETAKEWLGWEDETEDNKFGSDYWCKDVDGNKVRCNNNLSNRPFDENWARQLAQDILNKNYKFNGETIIRGRTGRLISGQHRLIGLVYAHQLWSGQGKNAMKDKWKENWPTEPTIESLVSVGISESPEVTRTVDNVKTRTFADVLFADTATFGKVKDKKTRIFLVRCVDTCVSFLWERLLRKKDSWEPRKTHSAALDFMARHPHVEEAVKHIAEENGSDNFIGAHISPGVAAGLLYLMGAAATDDIDNEYSSADPKREGTTKKPLVNWDLWDKACEFWTAFAGKRAALKGLHDALGALRNNPQGRDATKDEKVAVFVKAWNLFVAGKKVTADKLTLNYATDTETGKVSLDDYPLVAPKGIDKGSAKRHSEVPEPDEPEEEEVKESVEEAKARIKAEGLAAKKNGKATATAKKGKGKPPAEEEEEPEEEEIEEEEEEIEDEPGEEEEEEDIDEEEESEEDE